MDIQQADPKSFTSFVQGVSNMTGTDCLQFTHKKYWSYLNHLV